MVFVYSTFPNRKEAEKIGEGLIKRKLAACVNIFPINSTYLWKGKIVRDKEFAMVIKTKKGNFKKIERFILENHKYETPCILEIPISKITKKYSNWLKRNIK